MTQGEPCGLNDKASLCNDLS